MIRSLSAFLQESKKNANWRKNKVGTQKGEMCVGEMVVGVSEWHRLFGRLAVSGSQRETV